MVTGGGVKHVGGKGERKLPKLNLHPWLLVGLQIFETVNTVTLILHPKPVAEKALAVLNLRLIPNSEPPTLLMLSPSRDQSRLSPTFSGSPRLVKCLPSHYTDLQLYMLIRPFGPLAFARVENTLGGIVQFWNEGAARAAEVAVRSAFAQTSKFTLQVYNPCNVFFSVSANSG